MSSSTHKTPIQFTGNGREYFGIWIVNLLLSIVTLGVYSAWAKVRRKKYFYQNVQIDGVGFDYHANPVSILKGRAIAFVLFAIYTFSQQTLPILSIALGLAFLVILPWIIVRANIFNARNTSHRGLRFNFVGTVREAVRVFIGLPALLPFTLGLIFPYISQQRNQFLITNHRFGRTAFGLNTKPGDFYKIYLTALLLAIGIFAVLGAIAAIGTGAFSHGLVPDKKSAIASTIFAILLAYLVVIVLAGAFLQARLGNLIWNNASIDHLRFESTLRARDLIWIYGSNLLAIVISFGLLIPWAQIRTIRYRTAQLALVGEANFDQFVGDKKDEAKAVGEEIADMFDVDLSFG